MSSKWYEYSEMMIIIKPHGDYFQWSVLVKPKGISFIVVFYLAWSGEKEKSKRLLVGDTPNSI